MTPVRLPLCSIILLFALQVFPAPIETFRLHPQDGRYFDYQGKPTVLITATEHYGAVLNLDFDHIIYLDELQARGFNLTRAFSGAYREIPGSFGIRENTLAPKPGRFICPWARSSTPGASDGANKFDLTRWDSAYFARLRNFVAEAGKRGVIVELVLFCTIYSEELWQASPMNARNNISGLGNVGPYQVYAMKEKALHEAQEAMVEKIVKELNDAPNLYYEICNEPYERGGLTKKWTYSIIDRIVATESTLPRKHLIAEGINRDSPKLVDPHPAVSIFNFHTATPRCVQAMISGAPLPTTRPAARASKICLTAAKPGNSCWPAARSSITSTSHSPANSRTELTSSSTNLAGAARICAPNSRSSRTFSRPSISSK
jgi:hypothetical protein